MSLKAMQNVMSSDRHCFELYGYDIILDENLKPWLIEVNASPSLVTTTTTDRMMKYDILNDVFNIVVPPWEPVDVRSGNGGIKLLGGFEVLCDEEQMMLEAKMEAEKVENNKSNKNRPSSKKDVKKQGSTWK